MALLTMLLVVFVVALVPVMIGARVVGARNTGIGAAIQWGIALLFFGAVVAGAGA
jgi:hypothetical protein